MPSDLLLPTLPTPLLNTSGSTLGKLGVKAGGLQTGPDQTGPTHILAHTGDSTGVETQEFLQQVTHVQLSARAGKRVGQLEIKHRYGTALATVGRVSEVVDFLVTDIEIAGHDTGQHIGLDADAADPKVEVATEATLLGKNNRCLSGAAIPKPRVSAPTVKSFFALDKNIFKTITPLLNW